MVLEIQQYFDLMKDIEENVLSYLEESNQDDNFFKYLDDQKIISNKQIFKSFLRLLVYISNNYHRTKDFYSKIEKILIKYNNSISNFFDNSEIFHIFQFNKRILLFMIQQKLLTIDQEIVDHMHQKKFRQKSYIEYFYPEVKSFLSETEQKEIKNKVKELEKNDIEQFNEKRKIGENDDYICFLIRNDQVIDFITYLEKNRISPTSIIKNSIYETNHFLNNRYKEVKLIEYSAFFGAQQIFQYLTRRNIKLKSDIWPYAIHGKNAEIIHFLEENHVETLSNSYQYLVVESIKCHHNDISNYFQLNFCDNETMYDQYLLKKHLKYYNFDMKNDDVKDIIQNNNLFYSLCKYDYSIIVEALLSINKNDSRYVNHEFTIYKPINNQEDVKTSISIKNKTIGGYYYPEKQEISKDFLYDWYRSFFGEIQENEIPENENYYQNIEKYREIEEYENYYWRGNEYRELHEDKNYYWLLHKYNEYQEQLYWNPDKNEYIDKEYKIGIKTFNHNLEIHTALHISARKGNIDIIKLLINSTGIDLSVKSRKYFRNTYSPFRDYHTTIEKRTLLHEAIVSGYVDVVKIILSLNEVSIMDNLIKSNKEISIGSTANAKDRTDDHKTSLLFAVENGYVEIVRLLLEQEKKDINSKSISVVYKHGGCFMHVERCLRIEKPLFYAAIENENLNMVKICLDHPKIDTTLPCIQFSLDMNGYSDSAFEKYFKDSDEKVFNEIYPLFMAVSKGNVDIVRLLLNQRRIDINAISKINWCQRTALHEAVKDNQVEITKLLLQQKRIKINVYDEDYKKPINYAENEEIKKLLNNLARINLLKKFLFLLMIVLALVIYKY